MIWQNVVSDFTGLIRKLTNELGKYKICKTLKHDKSTVERWLKSGHPEEPSDVGSLLELGLRNGIDISEFQTYDSIYDLSPRRSYEEKLGREPPDMSWLTCAKDFLPEYRA